MTVIRILGTALLICSACGEQRADVPSGSQRAVGDLVPPPGWQRPSSDHIYDVNENLRAAHAKARATIAVFLDLLEHPRNNAAYMISAPLTQGEVIEHVWLTNVSKDGKTLLGTLTDSPMHVTNRKRGDRISVAIDTVSDWAIFETVDGRPRVTGGYTIRVERDQHASERPNLRNIDFFDR